MKKYNIILEEKYSSETEKFGLIETNEEVFKNEVLQIGNKSYFVEEVVNDPTAEFELLVVKEIAVKRTVKLEVEFDVNHKEDVKISVLHFLNDETADEIKFEVDLITPEELEEKMMELGIEYCEEQESDGIHYTEYYSEEYGSLRLKQRFGSTEYELVK